MTEQVNLGGAWRMARCLTRSGVKMSWMPSSA